MNKVKAVFIRRWPILLVTLALGMVAGGISASAGASRDIANYSAERVIVANSGAGVSVNVRQDALKVTRGAVPERAAAILGEPDGATRLARTMNARASSDAGSITLLTFHTDPEVAGARADAFAEAFLEIVNADLRKAETERLEQLGIRLLAAQQELESFDSQHPLIARGAGLPSSPEVDILIGSRQQLVNVVNDARSEYERFELETTRRAPYQSLETAAQPKLADAQLVEVPDSPLFRASLVGMIGLLMGVGLVLIVERTNARIDTRDELAELVPHPILAEIPFIASRSHPKHPDGRLDLDGAWAEQYRRVKSAIQFSQAHEEGAGGSPRVFLFASSLPAEGKSTSAAMTATALARDGQNTLVINADFRVPRIDALLGAESTPSLADRAELSTHRASVQEVIQTMAEPNLSVAASGPPTREVTRRLHSASEVAEQVAAQDSTVIIDSTPLHVANDTIDLLRVVDRVVFVVRSGRTTIDALQDALAMLEQHESKVLGMVLVGTRESRESRAYYGSYYSSLNSRSRRSELAAAVSSPLGEGSDDRI